LNPNKSLNFVPRFSPHRTRQSGTTYNIKTLVAQFPPAITHEAIRMIPTQKISLTLIKYAEPLINELEAGYSKCDLEGVLQLATCIWNACVLDQWRGTTEHVEAVRRQISKVDNSIPVAIVEALIVRKKQRFGNDPRGITNECVIVKNGEFVVRAEARLDLQNIVVKTDRAN
jgi:hypothetical protein